MVNKCEITYPCQNSDEIHNDYFEQEYKDFTPLNPETEDEMIYNMIEQQRREYYNAYIDYINDDFYFD